MTRVGAVVVRHLDPDHQLGGLCFRVITENGQVKLATWRVAAIRWVYNHRHTGVRTIFERVS